MVMLCCNSDQPVYSLVLSYRTLAGLDCSLYSCNSLQFKRIAFLGTELFNTFCRHKEFQRLEAEEAKALQIKINSKWSMENW